MSRIVMGIDPGRHTGVAVIQDGKLTHLLTINPIDIAATIAKWEPTRVVFEDSRLTSHLFTTNKNAAVAKSMARKVGQVDAICGLVVEACERLQIPAHGISPKSKGKKLDGAEFAQMTGWAGLSNEHTRDAAHVAWRYRGAA